MFVELHILQNFAPSCLNRDESNAPKDCVFGGYRRARISSQCIKRAMRDQVFPKILGKQNLATRSKKLKQMLKVKLIAAGKDEGEAETVTTNLIESLLHIKIGKDGDTSVLLFLGNQEIEELVNQCKSNWDALNKEKIEKNDKAIKTLEKILKKDVLDGKSAADLALFGRMVAEEPKMNIDAAAQVAHAISTNRMNQEFDFFTAIDEQKEKDDPGAGMMGTVEFNSACYYRYSNVDLSQLLENLHGDKDLAKTTVKAFVQAAIEAIPTGKQTSMAAQNPPSFVFAIIRNERLWSLVNAFVRPIPQEKGDLVEDSISALTEYYGWLATAYGDGDIKEKVLISQGGDLHSLSGSKIDSLSELVEKILAAIDL